jgi:hypothetical protein
MSTEANESPGVPHRRKKQGLGVAAIGLTY